MCVSFRNKNTSNVKVRWQADNGALEEGRSMVLVSKNKYFEGTHDVKSLLEFKVRDNVMITCHGEGQDFNETIRILLSVDGKLNLLCFRSS